MKQWKQLERVTTPDGSTLSLAVHDATYVLRVNGRELMSSRHSFSEEQLAVVACAPLGATPGVQVLIGGLGLGFTLRAALAHLAEDAVITVAELLPEVVAWNRNPAYPLSHAELADSRTRIVIDDVARVVEGSEARFDVILLDADNETTEMNTAGNAGLYRAHGLRAVKGALKKGGVAVYWSAGEDPVFEKRFGGAGFQVEMRRVRRHPAVKSSHYLYIGHTSLDAEGCDEKRRGG